MNLHGKKTFEWSKNKRYDFYVTYNNLKILIECHGKQHFEEGFENLGGRSLKEERENDKLKYEFAMNNGIDKYIVIDCRESLPNFIKSSILNTEMVELFDLRNVDWNEVSLLSEKSLVIYVNEIWNNGNTSIKNISNEVNLCTSTVSFYLKRGMENGWNDYSPRKAKLNGSKSRKNKVVQIDTELKATIYESASEASLKTNIDSSSISAVCKGKRKTAGGYRWFYFEDYISYIKQQNKELQG